MDCILGTGLPSTCSQTVLGLPQLCTDGCKVSTYWYCKGLPLQSTGLCDDVWRHPGGVLTGTGQSGAARTASGAFPDTLSAWLTTPGCSAALLAVLEALGGILALYTGQQTGKLCHLVLPASGRPATRHIAEQGIRLRIRTAG